MRLLFVAIVTASMNLMQTGDIPYLPLPGDTVEVRTETPEPVATPIPPPQKELAYSIVIENRTGGSVRAIEPPAQFLLARPGIELGKVERPVQQVLAVNNPTYAAVKPMTVAKSGVDGIVIKVAQDGFSSSLLYIQPVEKMFDIPDGETIPVFRKDAACLSIPAGEGLFGGSNPLIPGNPVSIYRDGQHVRFTATNTMMELDDVIIIEVRTPRLWPDQITIENRTGGAVRMDGPGLNTYELGVVDRPFSNRDTIDGGAYVTTGAFIEAGQDMLSIKLAPVGEGAGLALAARSILKAEPGPEIAPEALAILGGNEGITLKGMAPLFDGYLYPVGYRQQSRELPLIRTEVRIAGADTWLDIASLLDSIALADITHLRFRWIDASEAAIPEAKPQAVEPLEVGPADLPGFRGS